VLSFAAFAVKGLEDVLARELSALPVEVHEVRDKVVLFAADTVDGLDRLRTADDVCVLAGAPGAYTPDVDLTAAREVVAAIRPVGDEFSVTVTAARATAGTSTEIHDAVRDRVAARHRLTPSATGTRAGLDVRIFIDGEYAFAGLRLYAEPLSRRPYRVVPRMGSLRPTVAAAMVMLTCGTGSGLRVFDPFCGSGTILAEAAALGHRVSGSDLDPDAVAATVANVGATVVRQADALRPGTWPRPGEADAIITNMPWGKQIPIASKSELYGMVGQRVALHAAGKGRSCVLTLEPKKLLAAIRRTAPTLTPTTHTIGLLGETPTLVMLTAT
jgi:tRNA (guanine6-N2)-methyltransferase